MQPIKPSGAGWTDPTTGKRYFTDTPEGARQVIGIIQEKGLEERYEHIIRILTKQLETQEKR